MEESDMLRSYVSGIRSLSGAESATLFVTAPLSRLFHPLLVHVGEGPGVPELADLERARRFAAEVTVAPPKKGEAPAIVDSESSDAGLIPLPVVDSIWGHALATESGVTSPDSPTGRRRSDAADRTSQSRPAAWLGLAFPAGSGRFSELLESKSLPGHLRQGDDAARWWDWLFLLGGAMATHAKEVSAILRDPITGLADRAGFQAVLQEELEKAQRDGSSLSLLLINPDDFAAINERFGREAGDQIVREISARIRSALRSSDPIARYGGVIFAAILPGADYDTAHTVAEKINEQATEGAFLDGAVRLGFSIGIAVTAPEGEDSVGPLTLVRRADQALNAAKRLGGGCIVEWEQRSGEAESGAFDKLSGIFTGNMAKDYRNMVLLSDCIDVIAEQQDFDGLASEMVELLYRTFKPDRAALFTRDDDGELKLMRGLTRQRGESVRQERVETVELAAEELELVRLAIASGDPREERFGEEAERRFACAVPLRTGAGGAPGCLYIDGGDTLSLELSDLIFLKALGAQLAVALDRALLTEREQSRQENEKKRLRAELNELRQAVQQSKMVYRSAEMDSLVATARRVAPTDATVLITGESGTGKELLARTVHELSNRREQPFVIVDCGSIAPTLIESELFGHEKGAYTGAQQRRAGRLAEANGGSVLLDEIGELPLEVQSKLLRFVQEKQFTPVGGTRQRRVDVRIIAATNRDLASEVTAGTFREDLYYRLNVVRLQVPPLRERPDDIRHLARHFVEAFSVRYQKNIHRLSPDAERKIQSYPWPGNVRELQNRLMQAVILCEAEVLGVSELQLPETVDGLGPSVPAPAPANSRPTEPIAVGAADFGDSTVDGTRRQLRSALGRQIDLALESGNEGALPLGRWLSDDLILEANETAQGVARRGAALVGIPETTFRRRLNKASQQVAAGLSPRTGSWDEVRSILTRWVRVAGDSGADLLEQSERVLLEEILERLPDDTRRGSNLLGVTPPTYRSRVSQLAAAAPV